MCKSFFEITNSCDSNMTMKHFSFKNDKIVGVYNDRWFPSNNTIIDDQILYIKDHQIPICRFTKSNDTYKLFDHSRQNIFRFSASFILKDNNQDPDELYSTFEEYQLLKKKKEKKKIHHIRYGNMRFLFNRFWQDVRGRNQFVQS